MSEGVFEGNNLDAWLTFFKFHEESIKLLTGRYGARTVDDLIDLYKNAEGLLDELESEISRLEFVKFLKAKHRTKIFQGRAMAENKSSSGTATTNSASERSFAPFSSSKASVFLFPARNPEAYLQEYDRRRNIEYRINRPRVVKALKSASKAQEQIKCLELDTKYLMATSILVVFLFDCTGSMRPFLDKVKNEAEKVVDILHSLNEAFKVKLAFVGYRDHCDGENRFSILPFTENVTEFKDFLRTVQPIGGGDSAEDVVGGLNEVLKLSGWEQSNCRILLHAADAPAHGKQFHDEEVSDHFAYGGEPHELKADEILRQICELNIEYFFLKIKNLTDIMINEFNRMISKVNNYIQVQDINSHTMVEVMMKKAVSVASKSCSTSIRLGVEILKNEVTLVKEKPKWSSVPAIEARQWLLNPLISFTDLLDCLQDLSLNTQKLCVKEEFEATKLVLKIAKSPFNNGVSRAAHYAIQPNHQPNVLHVVKEFLYVDASELTKKKYCENLKCLYVAKIFGEAFNEEKPLGCPRIQYCDSCLLRVERDTKEVYLIYENQFIQNFEKYNNNHGYCAPSPSIDYQVNHEAVQAFSHYTYEKSQKLLMIVDCQGGFYESSQTFILSDAAINSSLPFFGKTNIGELGIRSFFKTHRCNDYCRHMHLPDRHADGCVY